jgi:hypothetical protein
MNRKIFIAVLLLSFVASLVIPAAASASQTPGPINGPFNDHYYQIVTMDYQELTWEQAVAAAAALPSYMGLHPHLATITSGAEQAYIAAITGASNLLWLGASDAAVEGTWTWITGEPFVYSNWNSGEPNNSDGVEHYLEWNSGGWNDNNSTGREYGYIVEYENAECMGTTNLALGKVVTPLTNTIGGTPNSVNDDNNGTVWYSYQSSSSLNENEFILDLGSTYNIGKISIMFGQIYGYTVSSSLDNSSWIERFSHDYGAYVSPTVELNADGTFAARYIKVYSHNHTNAYIGVGEIRVYEWLCGTYSTFTITSSVGEHGSISPSGVVTVDQGANQTFTITADVGYQIANVRVDGVSVGAVSSYTFTNVIANHTISASFAPSLITVGGSIAPGFIGTGPGSSGSSGSMSSTTPQVPVSLPNILVQSASLSASKVTPGSPVAVTASVVNKSTVNGITSIKLYVNGKEETSKGITVNSGSNTPVSFTVSRNDPGTYTVYVGGVSAGSFTVDGIASPDIVLYISVALILIALAVGAVYFLRRKQSISI